MKVAKAGGLRGRHEPDRSILSDDSIELLAGGSIVGFSFSSNWMVSVIFSMILRIKSKRLCDTLYSFKSSAIFNYKMMSIKFE